MQTWRRACCAVGGSVLAASGCASAGPHIRGPDAVEPVPAAEVVHTVLLLGDAGYAVDGGPVLREATRQASEAPERTTVAFLGDNVYPAGIPADGPGRVRAESYLAAQVEVARSSGARGIFVPGNHDWANGRPGGLAAIRRMGSFIRAYAGGEADIRLYPDGGCPGPTVVPVGTAATVVALDTEWWFYDGEKPQGPDAGCAAATEGAVLDSLGAILGRVPAPIIVIGHHPIASTGRHGGYFGWKAHLFPLRALAKWLWIPLPGVGSFYPLLRRSGIIEQDLSSATYTRFRLAVDSVLTMHGPLVYAAGHEHNLQVMEGGAARYLIVSGAGPSRRVEPVGSRSSTLYARAAPGFIRLDVLRDGRVRLAAIVIVDGRAREDYSTWLETP